MKGVAGWCFRRRRVVLTAWVLVLVVLGGLAANAGARFSSDFKLPDTESRAALDALTKASPKQAGETDRIVLFARSGTLDEPQTQAAVRAMAQSVASLPHVVSVGDIYEVGPSSAISPDRRTAYADVQLDATGVSIPLRDLKNVVNTARSAQSSALQVEVGGDSILYATGGAGGASHTNEIVGVVVAALVLFVAFGSLMTMFLPLITALFALGISMSIIALLTHGFFIADVAPTLAALIGLGVGIDYALFIVSRHRSNLQQGHTPYESVITAINTSGRAVLFAGITVCIGILGLMLLGISFFYGMAVAVVIAVLFTMLASITLLPALLGFVGMRALSRSQRKALLENGPVDSAHDISAGWSTWARLVQRHRHVFGALALAVMLVLALPVLSIRLGTTDAGGDPTSSTTRHAYDLLSKGFGPGFNGPLQLVATIERPEQLTAFASVVEQAAKQPNVATVVPPVQIPGTDVAVATVVPASSPQSEATTKLIDDLRSKVTHPARSQVEISIGGVTAIYHDFTKVLGGKLPQFMIAVIGLSFILLTAVFRSLLIPLVASAMNVLSAAASFGVVVAIFQWGWGASLFDIQQTGPILSFLPVMAFAILFGLSMDYEVFLVSRMYEEWQRTKDNAEAVALGQAETGRVITAAGAIMVSIFVSFVFGNDATIKLFGVALATAVLLDALIVRTVLVPALMNVIGKANWYLPTFIDKRLPKLNVESGE